MTKKTRKKIILPKKTNQVDEAETVVIPSLQSLISDAMAIMGSELAQYRSKTKRGITLDLKEARVVTGYLDALTRCSKEAREQARAEDLADLSDEELMQLATQLAKTAKLPKSNEADEAGEDDEAETPQ